MRRKMGNNDLERRIPERVRPIDRDTRGRRRRATGGHGHPRRQRKHHNDNRGRSHHIESLTTDRAAPGVTAATCPSGPPGQRLGRTARPRPGGSLRHDRSARGNQRGARRVRRPGRNLLAVGPSGRQLGHHRHPHRGAAGRQPRRRRPTNHRRRTRPPGRTFPTGAPLYPYRHQARGASDRLSPADLSLLEPHLDTNT